MIIALVCLSFLDIRKAECNVACKNWGYDQGSYNHASYKCECTDLKDYGDLHQKKLLIPKKMMKYLPHPDEDS